MLKMNLCNKSWTLFVIFTFQLLCFVKSSNYSSANFETLISELNSLKENSSFCSLHAESGVCKTLKYCNEDQSKNSKGKSAKLMVKTVLCILK